MKTGKKRKTIHKYKNLMLKCCYPTDFNDGLDDNVTEEEKVKSDEGNHQQCAPTLQNTKKKQKKK